MEQGTQSKVTTPRPRHNVHRGTVVEGLEWLLRGIEDEEQFQSGSGFELQQLDLRFGGAVKGITTQNVFRKQEIYL